MAHSSLHVNKNNASSTSSSSSNSENKPTQQRPQVVFVLGGPGAGKGTQCTNIVERYGYVHLSAGDLLREERQTPGSEHGELIESYIKDGKIVPVEITVSLLKKAMAATIEGSGKQNFLVDGFPRNKDNLDGWYKVMNEYAVVRLVLFFSCSEKVMEERLLKRGETSGRTDDNAESIKKRFKTYVDSTMPIIKQFEQQGILREINADQSVQQVFVDVQQIFNELHASVVSDGADIQKAHDQQSKQHNA